MDISYLGLLLAMLLLVFPLIEYHQRKDQEQHRQ